MSKVREAGRAPQRGRSAPLSAAAPAKPQMVSVRLLCIYSGDATSTGPGTVIEIDATEAARMIGLGAAEAV